MKRIPWQIRALLEVLVLGAVLCAWWQTFLPFDDTQAAMIKHEMRQLRTIMMLIGDEERVGWLCEHGFTLWSSNSTACIYGGKGSDNIPLFVHIASSSDMREASSKCKTDILCLAWDGHSRTLLEMSVRKDARVSTNLIARLLKEQLR